MDSPELAGSAPLANERWERFARAHAAGASMTAAWRHSAPAGTPLKTQAAKVGGSRAAARPEVRARIEYLRRVEAPATDVPLDSVAA